MTPKNPNLNAAELAARLERAAASGKSPKIAVVGDFCLDKYLYLAPELNEISVETGKTAFQIRAKKLFAGVGGTIANNLRALGAETACFGVVGDDGDGYDLLKALKNVGCDVSGTVVSPEISTGTYVKPLAPTADGAWEEQNRYDIRNPGPVPASAVAELKRNFRARAAEFDAVVVSDQFPPGSEAVFSDDFREFLAETAAENPNVFFLCDSRFFAEKFRAALVKCNASELLDVAAALENGVRKRETTLDGDAESNLDALCRAGSRLARRNARPVLATRGSSGSLLFDAETDEIFAIPSNPVDGPIDVCGAGDATNAGFVFAKSLGFSLCESAFLAGVVSSITIRQIGVTGTATVAQIVAELTAFAEKNPVQN